MKKVTLRYIIISLLTCSCCFSCTKNESSETDTALQLPKEESTKTRVPRQILADHINFDKLEKVTMSNNSGSFQLNNRQLTQLKKDLAKMTYHPGSPVKTGAIGFSIVVEGKSYFISSSTHGQYVEVPSHLLFGDTSPIHRTYYYKTNGVNLDNYKKR
jgi:hypothetical protein